MHKKYLRLEDISAYRIAFDLSNYVWNVVIKWNYFRRDTIGKQYVDAVDSISANIAEGFGRYSKSDKIRFYRISFSSLFEAISWTEKSKRRNLPTGDEYSYIKERLDILSKEINSLIRFTYLKLIK
ncbi:MAG: four helix bundle protein [Bacteroides sp. SM23_62_1]|nr:MAG: four helix bundle protein [Bacteroides sp. SM23_62_1]